MEVPPNEVMEMLPLDPLWDFASYDDFTKVSGATDDSIHCISTL